MVTGFLYAVNNVVQRVNLDGTSDLATFAGGSSATRTVDFDYRYRHNYLKCS